MLLYLNVILNVWIILFLLVFFENIFILVLKFVDFGLIIIGLYIKFLIIFEILYNELIFILFGIIILLFLRIFLVIFLFFIIKIVI